MSITDKNELINIFKNILNILRDKEHIIGLDALRAFNDIFILKMLEPKIKSGEIECFNKLYSFTRSYQNKEDQEELKKYILLSKFSEDECKKNKCNGILYGIMKDVYYNIICEHELLNKVISKNFFNIEDPLSFKQIIENINKIDVYNLNYDIIGDIYEEIIKDIMIGKIFGQFFTPHIIKKLMIKIIKPKLNENGICDSIFDPCLGSGGFIIEYINEIKKQSKEKNIKINWDYLKDNIGGNELIDYTFKLANSNILITSGIFFNNIQNQDSLNINIDKKYKYVLSNPPFGTKLITYDKLNIDKNKIIPIKSNNAISLFIQLIIHILEINGEACIVIPQGQDLNSKSNKNFINVRELLLKTCCVKKIIFLEKDIFENTSIKTCILYFKKIKEIKDVIKIIKETKTGKQYKFIEEFVTENIRFEKFDGKKTKFIKKINIDNLINNKLSFNIGEDIDENKYIKRNDVIYKNLEEICEFNYENIKKNYENEINYIDISSIKNGKLIELKKYKNIKDAPVSAKRIIHKNDILISSVRVNLPNYYFMNEEIKDSICSNAIIVIKTNNKDTLSKYIYYYIIQGYIRNNLLEKSSGSLYPHCDIEHFKNIKIPIIPIEEQQNIINYMDNKSKEYFDFIDKYNIKIINFYCDDKGKFKLVEKCFENIKLIEQINNNYNKQLILYNNIIIKNNETKNIEEICEFLPKSKHNASFGKNEGLYNFYTSSQIKILKCDKYEYEDECIIIGTGGTANIKFDDKFSCSTDNIILKSKDENILTKYIYYYLLNNIKILQDGFNGSCLQHISKEYIKNIKIPIIPIEEQQKIINIYDYHINEIKSNEEKINYNISLMNSIL
jgi:type I restriction-modification system DNA methylase subunit